MSESSVMMARMTFSRADLSFLRAGSRVSVDISGPAYVRLMVIECALFRREGFPYVFHGGLYARVRQFCERLGTW